MTGNVAQVFVSDDDWHLTLEALRGCVKVDGWFAFETRRPEVRDWERWGMAPTAVHLPDGSTVTVSRTVTEIALPLVTFVSETDIAGEIISSTSTLRFRDRAEIERDLEDHGFAIVDVRDAADRPGKEMLFLTRPIGR
jgi:hypothetical protein